MVHNLHFVHPTLLSPPPKSFWVLNILYHQPNKIMALFTSDRFRFVTFIMTLCMVQTKTSHLGKVSYAIILLD